MKTELAFKTVSVIGLGYIGLPTAAVIASRGINVIGVDVNQKAVDTINAGDIHIVEPDLDIVVRGVVSTGNLRATTTPEPAEAFMVAVPTPFHHGTNENGEVSHKPNLDYIKSAAKAIAPVLEKGNIVILESTSPVGATEKLAGWLAEARPDLSFPQDKGDSADIKVAHCPERVLPGYVLQELVSNDRVIGGMSKACSDRAVELYQTFVRGECVITNARTAEMAKLTENSFRDVNIAFANELSVICDKLKINVWELIKLANRHPRVNILQPGAGVGGHCIAVDPWFIVASAPEEARLIHAARRGNDAKPQWVLEKGKSAIMDVLAADPSRSMSDIKVACLGLAFKPDIDDLRESPALDITKNFGELGCQVLAVEPNITKLPAGFEALPITLSPLDVALEQADVICVLVKHSAFADLPEKCPKNARLLDVVGL